MVDGCEGTRRLIYERSVLPSIPRSEAGAPVGEARAPPRPLTHFTSINSDNRGLLIDRSKSDALDVLENIGGWMGARDAIVTVGFLNMFYILKFIFLY